MSRYPAEHCVPYRSRACVFSAMDTATGFPPTAMASRHAASCVLARQRLAAARPSTATPRRLWRRTPRTADRAIARSGRGVGTRRTARSGRTTPKIHPCTWTRARCDRYRTASTRNRSKSRRRRRRRRRRSPRRTSARSRSSATARPGRPATPRPSRARRTSTPRPRRNRPRCPPRTPASSTPRRRRSSSRPPGAAAANTKPTPAPRAPSRSPRRPGTRARRPRATRRRWCPATWGATWRRGEHHAPEPRARRGRRRVARPPRERQSHGVRRHGDGVRGGRALRRRRRPRARSLAEHHDERVRGKLGRTAVQREPARAERVELLGEALERFVARRDGDVAVHQKRGGHDDGDAHVDVLAFPRGVRARAERFIARHAHVIDRISILLTDRPLIPCVCRNTI